MCADDGLLQGHAPWTRHLTEDHPMPTISNATLNLTTINSNVTADVTFDVTFTRFERNLADLGMTFDRHVDIIGVDAGSTTVLTSFDPTNLPVTAGAGPQTIPVVLSVTKPRSLFQEDTDNDEIGCNIRIHSQGFPPVFTDDFFTNQRVLVG
jgi:hypothetical protein